MMNMRLKPKDVSEAYVLLSVISDPEGCKSRLDELVKLSEEAHAAQSKAEADKKYAAEEYEKMQKTLVMLRIESNELHEDKEAFAVSQEQFNQKVKARQVEVAEKDEDYRKKSLVLSEREKSVEQKERDADALMVKANSTMDKANSMKAEYEGKLATLKAMV